MTRIEMKHEIIKTTSYDEAKREIQKKYKDPYFIGFRRPDYQEGVSIKDKNSERDFLVFFIEKKTELLDEIKKGYSKEYTSEEQAEIEKNISIL